MSHVQSHQDTPQYSTHDQPVSADLITPESVGCWLDGAAGWHNHYRVVELAEVFGMSLSDEDKALVILYRESSGGSDTTVSVQDPDGNTLTADDAWEALLGQGDDSLVNQATAHLQTCAPAGHTFVWEGGDLLLVPDHRREF